jgi:hypothetical protein
MNRKLVWMLSLSWLPALPAVPLALLADAAVAQDAQPDQQVIEVRVTSAQPRLTVIDRGSIDGLEKQDRVVLRPHGGGRYEGTIVRIGERASVVELDDARFVPAPGTRGEVRIPRSRLTAPVLPVAAAAQDAQQQAAQGQPAAQAPSTPPEHPPWQRTGDEWDATQPLLARVRPLRPYERDARVSGRVYTIADYYSNTEGSTHDTFIRTGADLLYENVFGKGGDLHFDGEVNYRKADVPDDEDEAHTLFRLDRLSYTWGGNRFAPSRVEIGRFLQYEMPEFGVLDGLEWDRRLDGGDRIGASIGYLPEPDRDQKSWRDLSMAGWYRWTADESELFSMSGGYQKTFHNYDADRDLFVAKVLYLPPDGWTFTGTAWVDYYTASDTAKGSGLELTQAYVTTGRRFESGSELRANYVHRAFPETDRNEFTPMTQQQLADDHLDRVSLYGRQTLGRTVGMFGQVGAWHDQVEDGGDVSAGFDVEDMLFQGSRIEAAGFGTRGRFTDTLGWRASVSAINPHTIWRLGYEFTLNRIDGFQDDNNDIPQHRTRASWEKYGDSGWSFSSYVDLLFYDSETAVVTGILLQRSF